MNTEMKFCVACRHCRPHPDQGCGDVPHLSVCALFNKDNAAFMVTGISQKEFCTVARVDERMCGKAATRFEPIEEIDERR